MRRLLTSSFAVAATVALLSSVQAGDCAKPKPADCAKAPARKVIQVVKVGCCKPAPVSKCVPQPCHRPRNRSLLGLPKLELPRLKLPKLDLFGSRKSCCRPAPVCSGGKAAEAEAKKAPPVEDAPPPPYEENEKKDAPPPPENDKPAPAPPEDDKAADDK